MTGAHGKRAVIIGGSMSGLLSGLLLRRAGWSVDIFERVDSELSGRGAGIVAQSELIERLRALGLVTDDLGVYITTRKIIAKGLAFFYIDVSALTQLKQFAAKTQ